MDGLSLALALLAWVLIALLSFFHRDHRIARVAACHGLDAMDTAKRIGQIIRWEQPASVMNAPARICCAMP
jgi:hypothetical protein